MRRLLVTLALFPSFVAAQQHCVAALMQDKKQLDLSESSSLALAMMLKKSSSSGSDWSAGITIPVKGIPLNLAAGRSKTATESYFSQSSTSWSDARIVSMATQELSQKAVDAYRICVQADKPTGPRITVHAATATEATIEIRWFSPPMAPVASKATIIVSGGTLVLPFPTDWQTGVAASRIVRRDPSNDFRITADIGGETASEMVAAIPPVTAPKPRLLIGSCVGKGGLDGVRLWGPTTELCNGLIAWGSYDAQVREVAELGSCLGKGGVNGVRLYGPVGAPCAGMPNNVWGTYDTSVDVMSNGISSCLGHGNILRGHRLWGPAGERCGGMAAQEWGTYTEYNVRPR